jgi:LmbE family N-acetylglucosaminyl deacetylase
MNRQPLRVLAIGAHPDDLEFYCGGTLAKYAERGDTVVMAVATNGDIGSATHTMDEIREIRHQEAHDSAALIGAELIWMDYHDEFFFYNEETRRHMIEIIRQAEPDVVLGHWPDDYHPDHSLSGMAARDARIMTGVPLIVTASAHLKKIPTHFFYDTAAGINFIPEVYVDVSETYDTKKQMLACHKSQNAWIEDIFEGRSIAQMMEVQTAFRGLQAGVQYAEGFRALETFPRARDYSLLPME